MKAIAANTLLIKPHGQGEQARGFSVRGMERRIETGHLRHGGRGFRQRLNRQQAGGLMQGRERGQPPQGGKNLMINERWRKKFIAAMHDPVPGDQGPVFIQPRPQPVQQIMDSGGMIGDPGQPRAALGAVKLKLKGRILAQPFKAAGQAPLKAGLLNIKQAKLDAGRAGVDHQDLAAHASAVFL